jgi:hypothetical protein
MLIHKIYEGTESYLKSISLNNKFKLTDLALFYKSMLCIFSWALLFWLLLWIYFEMFYICVKWKCVSKGYDWVLEGKCDLQKW